MRFRKVVGAKDKGHSVAGLATIVAGLAALAVSAGCDVTPPTCHITSPADSASVSGTVLVAATATDSIGVERVEFYADGSMVGTDSSEPYSASWDASSLSAGTWHTLFCIAYDAAQNQGFSDTVAVEIGTTGPRSVYHGELDVAAHAREAVQFVAHEGDTLAGDVQVVTGGSLSIFMWLDQDNYQKFAAGQSYTPMYRSDNITQATVSPTVIAAGKYYLVFVNNAGAAVTCWLRFVLE